MRELPSRKILVATALALVCLCADSSLTWADTTEGEDKAEAPALKSSSASTEAEMKPYRETLANAEVTFEMVPIRGGTFLMGSPEDEEDRGDDEGPQHKVKIDPFWMGKCEVTWDEFDIFVYRMDKRYRDWKKIEPTERELLADAVSQPSPHWGEVDPKKMGGPGCPAIRMTQYAAKMYCEWLSAKTGHYYRLPTEAEWEYACRAGTTTAFSFGDDVEDIDDYAWYADNTENDLGDPTYQLVGTKKPNPWGLHDMHGNVAEWVLDSHSMSFYARHKNEVSDNPLCVPAKLYGRVVRGGCWDDEPVLMRSASRQVSKEIWKKQDPQLPQSFWHHTLGGSLVGFRVIRPLREPTAEEKKKYGPDKIQVWERPVKNAQ